MNVTKTQQVKEHLINHGTITSWEAIQKYGETRLAAIIFTLRKNGYDIKTNTKLTKDRNGNVCSYAEYVLIEEGK